MNNRGCAECVVALATLVLTISGTAWARGKADSRLKDVRSIYVENSGYDASEQASNEARRIIAAKTNKTCFTLANSRESADAILSVKEESAGGMAIATTKVVPGGNVVTAVTTVSPNSIITVTLSLYVKSSQRTAWEDSMTVGDRWLAPRKLLPKLSKDARCKGRHR